MALPEVAYTRRKTRPVRVGNVTLGGENPIVVQSMITEETHNVVAAVAQIIAMHQAGSEIVRVTTPNLAEARCLAEIKARLKQQYQDVPLSREQPQGAVKVMWKGTVTTEVAKVDGKLMGRSQCCTETIRGNARS